MRKKSYYINSTKINVFENSTDLFQSLYMEEFDKLTKGFCVLPGGKTPVPLYDLLRNKNKIKFLISDDRLVDNNNDLSNFKNITGKLKTNNEYPISYFDEINLRGINNLNSKLIEISNKNCIDISVLGLGSDSHSASLFPNQKINFETNSPGFIIKNNADNFKRFTLSYKYLLSAKKIIFLVIGIDKSMALKNILFASKDSLLYPAQEFIYKHSNVEIYCDTNATDLIKNKLI
ncbi:6-phosphogluconolactonase [Flavobacteriaceae bacterium]|nr:6-phosphogluconolactonase [Flavobacteriaceae bacterium]